MHEKTPDDITRELAEPFDSSEVKFKPAVVNGNRALALPYVDARCIQDRLDEVLGVIGWQDTYECLPDGSVVCSLSIKIGGEWIRKMDVGSPSEQPDEGDRRKAAFSDALKRAAVKFGIGRHLYRLKPMWVDYDPQRKQFVKPPQLPDQAPVKVAARDDRPAAAPAPATKAEKPKTSKAPQTAAEFVRWLKNYDAVGPKEGRWAAGAMKDCIDAWSQKTNALHDVERWDSETVKLAVDEAKRFAKGHPSKPAAKAG